MYVIYTVLIENNEQLYILPSVKQAYIPATNMMIVKYHIWNRAYT